MGGPPRCGRAALGHPEKLATSKKEKEKETTQQTKPRQDAITTPFHPQTSIITLAKHPAIPSHQNSHQQPTKHPAQLKLTQLLSIITSFHAIEITPRSTS
jgi:hypothetical protein